MHQQTAMFWSTTFSAKSSVFFLFLVAQMRNDMKLKLKLLSHGMISERTLIRDFQMRQIKFEIDWTLNTVVEETEKGQNFLNKNKWAVDRGWPEDMHGIPNAEHNAERAAQGRQRRQRCVDYSLRGLRPKNLQQKVQE